MKRETLRHPKLYDLMARLKCSRPEALGYLTLLWDFTAECSTDGSIGRWPDGSIARAVDWPGEPSDFIESLVQAGWLDRDSAHRLLIHNWSDHCERWVKLKLDKLQKPFAEPSIDASIDASVDASVDASPPRDQTKPNQTKPNQTKPNQTKPRTPKPPSEKRAERKPRNSYSEEFAAFWNAYPKKGRVGKPKALASWNKALAAGTNPQEIITAAEAYTKSGKVAEGYVCHATTWLNAERWTDDPEAWTGSGPAPIDPHEAWLDEIPGHEWVPTRAQHLAMKYNPTDGYTNLLTRRQLLKVEEDYQAEQSRIQAEEEQQAAEEKPAGKDVEWQ